MHYKNIVRMTVNSSQEENAEPSPEAAIRDHPGEVYIAGWDNSSPTVRGILAEDCANAINTCPVLHLSLLSNDRANWRSRYISQLKYHRNVGRLKLVFSGFE